jgi:N-carbamoylputrescine amidase
MERLKVAAASIRNRIGDANAALSDMARWGRLAAEKRADLILFPELNVTGHFRAPFVEQVAETIPGPSTEKAIDLAAEVDMTIGFGIIEREGNGLYCTHVLVNGSGLIGKQRKIHVPSQEQPYWKAGDSIRVFDMGPARIGITICRDSFFDEMTRTLYFKGAEIVLMPFGYFNVPRSRFLTETIHAMCIIKSCWTNGLFAVLCNSAGEREPSEWELRGRKFPGWAGVVNPWGEVIHFVDDDGNDERLIVVDLDPEVLTDRREHPNFLAGELRPELYQFE